MGRTPNNTRTLRVFLCHTVEDKAAVRDLYYKLRSDGFEPWLDEENLLPGQEWQHEIPKVIRDSDVVIICLSNNSIIKKGFVQKEINFALDVADEQPEGSIYLIPLRLEKCEIPQRLKKWQWVDLFGNRGYRHLKKTLFHVSEKIGITKPNKTVFHKNMAKPDPNSLGDYRFPPGIIIASTKKQQDLMPGKYKKKVQLQSGSLIHNMILVPARPWLEMFTNEPLSLVRNPAKQGNGKVNTWTGITTIGADAFKIENGLLDPNILRRRLKRAALLFDRIAVYDLVPALSVIGENDLTNELKWLLEQDIICQPEVDDEEYAGLSEEYIKIQKHSQFNYGKNYIAVADALNNFSKAQTAETRNASFRVFAEALDYMMWWQIRSAALWFGEVYGAHVVPILENPPAQILRPRPEFSKELLSIIATGYFDEEEREIFNEGTHSSNLVTKKGDVIQIILNSLPLPGNETSWQDLITYKNETGVRHHLLALRNWSNETARLELPPYELADKLEWLTEQYKTHVRLHKMKFEMGTAELILTTTASAIEELLHFRFGSFAKMLFGLKRARVDLLEAEIQAPGSEVAYVLKTGQEFDTRY